MSDVSVAPTIATSVEALDDAIANLRARQRSVAVVMTMGALHAGHAQLIRAARAAADSVVVTIFVNPLQFGAGEDLDRYPRTLADDLAVCTREGAAVVFVPDADGIYPQQPRITISAGDMGSRLCGRTRPGHFDGVLTVVAKLLHLVGPDVAVFGEKDAQQLALIRRMVADLDFEVEIVAVPIVREPDGLAMSSRNAYLSLAERETALSLCRAIGAGAGAAAAGPDAVRRAAAEVLDRAAADGLRVDYLEVVDPDTLDPAVGPGRALLAVAAWVGTTRLIDNVEMIVGGDTAKARTHQEP
ncbi:MAG TPA: pantoate--beta-alanine ligase [Mycobacteriales bacterium]|nr:pantoate--beta-alanine ligase [Mycobacteriales bacterium]